MRLKLPDSFRIHPVFHVSLLRPVQPDRFPYRGFDAAPDPVLVDDAEEFVVRCVLDSRFYYGKLQYLVGWKGYGPEDNTWVLANEVRAPALTSAFHRLYPSKPSVTSTPPPRRHAVRPVLGSRPRGRPPRGSQSLPSSSASSIPDSSFARRLPSPAVPARPRGRPRKHPVLASPAVPSSSPASFVARRPRGRPRKHPIPSLLRPPVLPVLGPSPSMDSDVQPVVGHPVDPAVPRPSRPRGRPRKHPLVAGPPPGSGPSR